MTMIDLTLTTWPTSWLISWMTQRPTTSSTPWPTSWLTSWLTTKHFAKTSLFYLTMQCSLQKLGPMFFQNSNIWLMVHHTMSIAHPYISELMIFWTKLKVVWRMTLQTKVCFALLHEIAWNYTLSSSTAWYEKRSCVVVILSDKRGIWTGAI